MTWISLVCLLALSSSAFAGYGQQGGYGSALPKVLSVLRDNSVRRPVLPIVPQGYGQPQIVEQPFFGQPQTNERKIQTGYGSQLFTAPKALPLPVQSYGGAPRILNFEQPEQVQQLPIVTEADNLCQGQAPETVIPLDNGRRFVVCLDSGKGTELQCPSGLYYKVQTRRCERKLGPQDFCASQPCLNGGQCVSGESTYECQCAPGFDGKTCELDARVCQTQNPCGQSQGTRCQSFRVGAALQYMCILQDGFAYGLNGQQAVPSPCHDTDGPQALSVTNKGFIMCDGERMFVESCPGGTIWEDGETKACVWPDMQSRAPQLDEQPQMYGHRHHHMHKQMNGGLLEQPKLIQGYGSQISKPVFEQPQIDIQPMPEQPKLVQGPGSQWNMESIVEQPQLGQGYGSQISKPVFEQPKLTQGFGSQIEIQPMPEQLKPTQGYGSQWNVQPIAEQPKLTQGFGSQIEIQPMPEQPKPTQGYGSQWNVQPIAEQSKLTQGYGSQISKPVFEQPKLTQGYGY